MSSGTRNGEIRIVGVTKRFGDMTAVRDLSLTIPDRSYCCLLGPSGCGKTTILRMIAGHETPTTGEIRIGGAAVTGLSPVQRGTAMMFQSYALFPHRSVLDNVAFSLKLRGASKADRHRQARDLLAKVRMERFADRLPAQLSGGQQQRAALSAHVLPSHHANAFFLTRQRQNIKKRILPRQLQDLLDDGIRHVAEKANIVGFELLDDAVRP